MENIIERNLSQFKSKEDTLPKLLKRNYEKYGDKKVAIREKDYGIWQSHTWKEYYELIKYFSLGLISLGLEAGDKVCILGENEPEWFISELAVQSACVAAVGIPSDCTPPEVKHYVVDSESKFVVTEDQEQTDKLLELEFQNEIPLVRKVIYWDPKGLWNYDEPILMYFYDVIELGKEYEKSHSGLFEDNVERGKGEDIAIFCYTSGTTGLPKGAMVSHRALVNTSKSWCEWDGWSDKEQYLSFVAPSWIAEQMLGLGGQLHSGMEVNFPEEPETVQENIREIGADLLFFGPRQWESLMRTVQVKIIDTSRLRRLIYNLFLPIGYRVADFKLAYQRPSLFWRILNWLAYEAVFRPLRDKLGLLGNRVAYTGGAGISPDTLAYFLAIGVNVKLGYGSSEVGIMSYCSDKDNRPEACGPPLPGIEMRLSKDSELLARGFSLFSGYYKKPEASRERIPDGWCHTEDFGHIREDGHLIVMDRMEDLAELKSEQKYSPQYAESRLRFSPYIKDILVVGDGRDFVGAIVDIDAGNVGKWAEARHIPYTTHVDLSQKPQVLQLVKNEIGRINLSLPEWARIKKFVNLHKEFDPDEAELTRTRKMRRTFVEERYKEIIGALYGDKEEFAVEAPIVYRDGKKGVIKTVIHITAVD